MLENKHILLVVSGGIAAIKAPDLVRRLRERGATVRCILTKGGAQVTTPMALSALTGRFNVQLRAFPQDVIRAARTTSTEVLGDLGNRSAVARKVHDSYVAFRERAGAWSRISLKSVLEARES